MESNDEKLHLKEKFIQQFVYLQQKSQNALTVWAIVVDGQQDNFSRICLEYNYYSIELYNYFRYTKGDKRYLFFPQTFHQMILVLRSCKIVNLKSPSLCPLGRD